MDLTPYTGGHARLPNPRQAAVLLENSTFSRNIYRTGSVDDRFFDDAVVLTAETATALYADFTPPLVRHIPGTRPFLERVAAQVTAGMTTDRQKALALMDWVCALPELFPRPDPTVEPFHGGTEEEVVRKGSSMCNEQSRVLIVLAQLAGLPARYIGHMTAFDFDDPASGSGHGVTELFVEDTWAYIDIRGKFFLKDDGRFATTWDLVTTPALIDRQPPEVVAHVRKGYTMESSRRYFAPDVVHIVCNYAAADHAQYDYSWVYPSRSRWIEARERAQRLRSSRHVGILPQPRPRGGI